MKFKLLPSKAPPSAITATFALAGLYVLFSLIARYQHHELGDIFQLLCRYSVAVVLAPVFFKDTVTLRKLFKIPARDLALLWARAFLTTILGAVTWVMAINMGQLGKVSFIQALPIECFWGLLLFREKPGKFSILAILLAVCGGLILFSSNATLQFTKGDYLALCASFFFPLGIILRRFHSEELHDTHLTQLMFTAGLILLAITAITFETKLPNIPSANTILIVVVAGSLILLSMRLSSYVFQNVPATTAGVILAVESPLISCIGYVVFGEIPSLQTIVGGAVIVFAVIVMSLYGKQAT